MAGIGGQFGFTENVLDGIEQRNLRGGVQWWMTTMLDETFHT